MKIIAYNVGCGDCLRIEFTGTSGKARNLMIDGGFERTYRDILANEFVQLEQAGMMVDLWVISHIHDDHIGGTVGYVGAVLAGSQNDIVSRWWYNPPRLNLGKSPEHMHWQAKSIAQSDRLGDFLQSLGKLQTGKINNELERYMLDGMAIEVLSPDIGILGQLAEKYADAKLSIERIEDEQTHEAKSSRQPDYHIPATAFNLAFWKQDLNLENAGSIALLIGLNGRNLLFLADAHPSVVVSSLARKGFSQENKLRCDLVKVSHHGSMANNSDELYSMIECNCFLVTCDGTNKYGLPQKACILRILTATGRNYSKKYSFYFSSGDPALRSMFDVDGQSIFEKLNFDLNFPASSMNLVLETDQFQD